MRQTLRNVYLNLFGTLKTPSPGIHILNSHFVTPFFSSRNDEVVFENFLKFLSRYCRLITIQDAIQRLKTGNLPENKCMVAFTFDDGFAECYHTIAPALEKFNTNAAFFINSNYIDSDKQYQLDFNKRINTYTKGPLTWKQVKELHNRGHVIGAHTLDHLNMAQLSEEEIDQQLFANKEILENKLKYQCDYFAWTYGGFQHFSKNALHIAQKYHKYIFSATNYQNYFSFDGQVINRRHIEAFWPKSHIKYFLSIKKTL